MKTAHRTSNPSLTLELTTLLVGRITPAWRIPDLSQRIETLVAAAWSIEMFVDLVEICDNPFGTPRWQES